MLFSVNFLVDLLTLAEILTVLFFGSEFWQLGFTQCFFLGTEYSKTLGCRGSKGRYCWMLVICLLTMHHLTTYFSNLRIKPTNCLVTLILDLTVHATYVFIDESQRSPSKRRFDAKLFTWAWKSQESRIWFLAVRNPICMKRKLKLKQK